MSPDIVVGRPSGGRLNRTILATAGAVLLALFLSLLSPLGAAKAFAINDANDVNWDISGGRNAYQQMINDVRGRVEQQALYGNGSQGTVWATDKDSGHYFLVNVHDGPNLLTRIVVEAHNLYVQGFYRPSDRTYNYFSDAALRDVNWMPSSSTEPASQAQPLPFGGSYINMTRAAGSNQTSPVFSTRSLRDNANALADQNASGRAQAAALLWLVEGIAEGARFNAISDRIVNGWNDGWGYNFDDSDVGLITNWQVVGDNFQRRLANPGTQPTQPIGRYHFDTLASTAAILCLAMWFSS
ncbi:ribosome-inactivating family protein [Streptomyces sp. NPDC001250]|uniref:ribosome-inactivating family protein n=1 Tax=unclassified Streptomyces TaxID=2593676 RepID=UPI00331797B5